MLVVLTSTIYHIMGIVPTKVIIVMEHLNCTLMGKNGENH